MRRDARQTASQLSPRRASVAAPEKAERFAWLRLSRNDSEPLTTDFTDDTDAKHLDEGQETVEKVHHLASALPAGIVLKPL